jgi:hypothetical protein
MIKAIFILSMTVFFSRPSFSQSKCDIKEHYNQFIFIQKLTNQNKSYLSKSVIDPKISGCFKKLLNNSPYISYLLYNFSSTVYDSMLIKTTDSVARHKEFIQYLKTDTLFNKVMSDLIRKTVEKSQAKDSVSMDKLLNVAVKFFSIQKLTNQGYYVGKLCVGVNGLEKTENIRQPQLEAFCYTSIFNNYEGENFNMYAEFVKAIKELYRVSLGIDPTEKLYRAQGAMFFLMWNNNNLRLMLKSEYEKNKENLPFILTDK